MKQALLWLLLTGLALASQPGASDLPAADRAQILARVRRWVRFLELPTSPALRPILPQMPRWLEVKSLGAPTFSAEMPPLAANCTVQATARCLVRLEIGSNEHTYSALARLDFARIENNWTLFRASCDPVDEPVPPAPSGVRQLGEFHELARVKGGPLSLWRFGTGDNVTLLFSAIHGDERNTAPLLEELVRYLERNPGETANCTVVVVPLLNQEGWARGTRQNGQGVDANRNFPFEFAPGKKPDRTYSGQRPLQTPEALALQHLVQAYRPDKIVSVHCPLDLINYDGPAADLAAGMQAASGQSVSPSIGYPTPGSFGTYAGLYLGIPTITLELPEQGSHWERQREALLSVIHAR